MGPWRRRPTKDELARRERWQQQHLPRIRGASRPNAVYIKEPHVVAVLQHLSDGVNEVLMARPLTPFPWLADYLRHACKVAYCIEQDAATVLMAEMHKKRRVIQNALLDTKADERESKRLIQAITVQQKTLHLPDEELRLDSDDHAFLAAVIPSHQSQWSVDMCAITLPALAFGSSEPVKSEIDKWVNAHLRPQRHLEPYVEFVMEGVTQALVELELASPENSAEWLVLHFKQYEPQTPSQTSVDPQLALFFKTNYELMRKIDTIKHDQREMHLRRERLTEIHEQLRDELATRQRFIDKLRKSNTTARTQAIMTGTAIYLNSQKLWILPGALLIPEDLTPSERQGLHRAEQFLMEEDETRWRFLLLTQKRYDAATKLQAAWRCSRDYRVYEEVKAKRRHAANVIQRNYFHYLYVRAISLPAWCVLGREVVVAPSVAQKCAVTFQFYPKKDFPTGNFKRLEGLRVAELMEACRQDEGCAAFSTDGAMKRFVPRKLSQLTEMAEKGRPLTMKDGIYIKVFPSKTDKVVNTAIITALPVDRFGLVTVVIDGIHVQEQVPVQKLSDRWKKIRIRRHHQVEKKRMAFVFGGKKIVDGELGEPTMDTNYDVLEDEEDEEDVLRREKLRRVRVQSNEVEAEDPLLGFVYEDRATKEVRDREPHRTFIDEEERCTVIAKRRKEYEQAKAKEYEAKKLQSVVRLQCAWRSKRARAAFRQILQLRAKEKEREKLVTTVHQSNQQKKQLQARGEKAKDSKAGFFSRWRRV